MPKFAPIIVVFLLSCAMTSCQQDKSKKSPKDDITYDETDTLTILEHIIERGRLIAVTDCGPLNYTMKDGRPCGFQYELLNDFCNTLGVKLELQVIDNLEVSLQKLDSCQTDLVATDIGLSKSMRSRYQLSNPILYQRSVLVQRLPRAWHDMSTGNEIESQLLRMPTDLARKIIHVPNGTHHVQVLEHLSEEIGDTIFVVECDTSSSFNLIMDVLDGNIDYTIACEHTAKMSIGNNTNADIKCAVSLEQPIGWAMRASSDSSLLIAVNKWIDKYEQKEMRHTMAKYIMSSRSNANAMPEGCICVYDKDIKIAAKSIGWDWRMLASLIYQESRFKADLESDKGAFGLMQLMPVVMEKYGIGYESSPEEQLAAGAQLIAKLDESLSDKVADKTERTKFVLAAYNCGLGHILDARRLAEKYGRCPNVWTDNVDFFILNKSKPQYYNDTCCHCGYLRGTETHRFVEEVTERYEHYKALIPN